MDQLIKETKYKNEDYPINPELCKKCYYGSKSGLNGYCDYIGIVGHSKSKVVDHDHCNEFKKLKTKEKDDLCDDRKDLWCRTGGTL